MHFFPSPASKNIGVPGTIPQDFKRSDVLAALQKEEKRKERISKDQMIWHLAVSAEPLSKKKKKEKKDIQRSDDLAPGSVCRAALPSNGGESDSYRSLLSHLGDDEDEEQD